MQLRLGHAGQLIEVELANGRSAQSIVQRAVRTQLPEGDIFAVNIRLSIHALVDRGRVRRHFRIGEEQESTDRQSERDQEHASQ